MEEECRANNVFLLEKAVAIIEFVNEAVENGEDVKTLLKPKEDELALAQRRETEHQVLQENRRKIAREKEADERAAKSLKKTLDKILKNYKPYCKSTLMKTLNEDIKDNVATVKKLVKSNKMSIQDGKGVTTLCYDDFKMTPSRKKRITKTMLRRLEIEGVLKSQVEEDEWPIFGVAIK